MGLNGLQNGLIIPWLRVQVPQGPPARSGEGVVEGESRSDVAGGGTNLAGPTSAGFSGFSGHHLTMFPHLLSSRVRTVDVARARV